MARTMKDSGIKWIGKIPADWSTIKFKYLHDGLNTGEGLDKDYWSADDNDIVFYTAGLEPIRTSFKEFPKWKYTKENDLLLSRNGTPYVYMPVPDACYTDHIIRASIKDGINKRFVRYSLQQSIASVVVDSVSLATWSASLWNQQTIAWPTPKQQQEIVDYLDQKCAEIDRVIAETEKTVAEYKALKQSIITEATTHGIRGNRPMKDSGVIWIQAIPEDWQMIRGKGLFVETDCRSVDGNEELLTVSQYTGITPRSQKMLLCLKRKRLKGIRFVRLVI